MSTTNGSAIIIIIIVMLCAVWIELNYVRVCVCAWNCAMNGMPHGARGSSFEWFPFTRASKPNGFSSAHFLFTCRFIRLLLFVFFGFEYK